MDKWEYLTLHITWNPKENNWIVGKTKAASLQEILSPLGEAAWELVNLFPVGYVSTVYAGVTANGWAAHDYRAILKRKKP
jgi:hypothetical protein